MGFISKTGNLLLDHELSFLIFSGNYEELLTKVKLVDCKQYMWIKMDMPTRGEDDFVDLVRLLHNFLLSAATLIDHYRVLFVHYEFAEEFKDEYNAKTKQIFADDILSCTVKRLRNYYTHRQIPTSRLTFAPGTTDFRFYIQRDELLSWDGWNQQQAQFLSTQSEDIEVIPLLEPYYKKSKEFFDWFCSRYKHFHQDHS